MSLTDEIQKTVEKTANTVAMREAVTILLSPDGNHFSVRSNMAGKAETMNVLLVAVNMVAMKNEEPKSPIVKPTPGQVARVS